MNIKELNALAATLGVKTHSINCTATEAISMDYNGNKVIGIAQKIYKSEYKERHVFAHELAHVRTNAYYTDLDSPINIKRMEYRANKCVIELLISKEELKNAMHDDITAWDLAEQFDVPIDMIKKAMWIYFKKEIA